MGESVSSEFCEIEISTPDNTINSDMCHIAEQERTFSEENMPQLLSSNTRHQVSVTVHDTLDRNDLNGEGSIVYSENEKDTSCVVDVSDSNYL